MPRCTLCATSIEGLRGRYGRGNRSPAQTVSGLQACVTRVTDHFRTWRGTSYFGVLQTSTIGADSGQHENVPAWSRWAGRMAASYAVNASVLASRRLQGKRRASRAP